MQQTQQQNPPENAPAVHSNPRNQDSLENKVDTPVTSSTNDNLTVFERAGISLARSLYTPAWMGGSALLAYTLAGAAPIVMAFGLATGQYFVSRKQGRKFTLGDFKKEYLKGLAAGTVISPLAAKINAAKTFAGKVFTYLGFTAPSFMATDNFVDYYQTTYSSPSNLFRAVKQKGAISVLGEGLAYTIKETPKVIARWYARPPLVLPTLATINWTMKPEFYGLRPGQEMPIKYAVSAVTTSGYRYFTARQSSATTATPQLAYSY
jgi:hypothetical protein